MPTRVVSELTPDQVQWEITGFAQKYVADWETWLSTPSEQRARIFGSTLRKWQACRPYTMRRTRNEAKHGPPFLQDLIEQAQPYLELVQGTDLRNIQNIEPAQSRALHRIWEILRQLSLERPTSCVGITKAVLLLTDGRIGPAFDSRVRARLGIDRFETSRDWIAILVEVGADIRTFELKHGLSLADAAPLKFRHLQEGRLYDMILGPRGNRI